MAEQEFKHIVRIVNTDLDGNKQILYALRKIRGVSYAYANITCNIANIDKGRKTGELSDDEVKRLNEILQNPRKYQLPAWVLNRRRDYETGEDKHLFSGDIEFFQSNDIKRLKMIKSYRGMRHAAGLPVRGQRTKSNFRRNKGKVMGVKRKSGVKAGRV